MMEMGELGLELGKENVEVEEEEDKEEWRCVLSTQLLPNMLIKLKLNRKRKMGLGGSP